MGKYFLGYVSWIDCPFDFPSFPDNARLKKFVKMYLEEKYKLLEKPISEITENKIEHVSSAVIYA